MYEIDVVASGEHQPAGSFTRSGRNVVVTIGRVVGPGASVIVRLGRRVIARATVPIDD